MNLRDLVYIRAVARLKHFGLAAEACNVSQPALSSQIRKLEDELGVPLFERTNKSVRITRTGEKIVELAGDVLNSVDKIKVAAEMARDPMSGETQLGCIPTLAPYLVPGLLQSARRELPNLEIRFQEDLTERLTEELLAGSLDAAILATPPEHGQLTAISLFDEPFWLICSTDHTLSNADEVCAEDLPTHQLLLLAEGHCFRDQAMDICQMEVAPMSQTLRATSLSTLINLVAVDEGVTLLPALALQRLQTGDGLTATKLSDPAAHRRIYLTYRKTFPREERLAAIGRIIREGLPNSVTLVT